MQRREFIIKSGVVLTAAAFFSSFSILTENGGLDKTGDNQNDPYKKRPNPNNFKQPIMKAIAVGLNAPSPHNVQSWKFKILSDETMLFYVDNNKLLPETDPPARQIHIGAGCFIETLLIGVTQYNLLATIDYFPEGYNSPNDFGVKPVAKVRVSSYSGSAHDLSPYILRRQTNRRQTTGEAVSKNLFDELMLQSGKCHAQVLFKNQNLEPFKEIFYKGLEIESRTHRTNEETRLLFRFSEEERAATGDGLSMPQMGFQGLLLKIVEQSVKKGDPKIWHDESTIEKSLKTIKKSTDSTKAVVIWVTDNNNFNDWLETGRDYVRFSLAAASKNLFLHPYNQAIQEYDEMATMRTELDKLVGVAEGQKIQFISRIGHSSPSYYSYRKSVDKYLV